VNACEFYREILQRERERERERERGEWEGESLKKRCCAGCGQLHLEDVHPRSGLTTPFGGGGTTLEHLHPSRGRTTLESKETERERGREREGERE
jgi:hypothetical protein